MNIFDLVLEQTGKKLSSEQMQAVDSRVATVVSAGAGSGKTTVLSFRFLKLVLEGYHADRILTLTFTKKAAAEMYERIHALLAKAASISCSEKLTTELKENFPKAYISTMDSFWTEIARIDCLKYGIARNFQIIDEDDIEELSDRILAQLMREERLADAFLMLSSSYDENGLKGIFQSLARHSDVLSQYRAEDAIGSVKDFVDCISLESKKQEQLMDMLKQIESYREYATADGFFQPGGDFDITVNALKDKNASGLKDLNIKKKSVNIGWTELKTFIKEVYRPLKNEVVKELSLEMLVENQVPISRIFEEFIKRLNIEKRRKASLTFLDVEALAKRILIENKSVRSFYKNKFDFIMVDEFQDNNNEQKEILFLLSERNDQSCDGIPAAENLDKKKLFFVGDDKQSIYKFRGADVSVFNNLKNEVVSQMGGQALSLGANYRSEPKLVEHFNKVFSSVFEKVNEDDDSCYDRAIDRFTSSPASNYFASASDIKAGRDKVTVEPKIELNIFEEAGESEEDIEIEDTTYMSMEDSEAEFIASKIKEMVSGRGYMIPTKTGERKPVYDDIGVLFGKTKTQMPIEKALRRHGIPYTVVDSTSVTLEGLAYDFYAFLQLLVYPKDKKSYIEVLVSPFARISNEGLSFLQNDEFPDAFSSDVVFSSSQDQIAYDNLSELYKECLENAGRERVTATLERMYYKSGYRTYLLSRESLAVYDEHFDYLWAIADSIDSDGGNIVSFLDYIRPMIGSAEKLQNLTIQRLGNEGVKLMTIHKSKGLEFPIVFVAGMGSMGGTEASNCIVDTKHEDKPFLMYFKEMATYFNAYNQKRVDEEQKRVLYVALTRAVNHLVLTAINHKFQKKEGDAIAHPSLYMLYYQALERAKITNVDIRHIGQYEDEDIKSSTAQYKSRNNDFYESATTAKAPVWHDVKLGVKEKRHAEIEFSSLSHGPELPLFDVESILMQHSELRADYGTLVHSAFEFLIKGEPLSVMHRSYLTETEEEDLYKSALALTRGFKTSDFWKTYIEGAKELIPEVGFFYPEGDMVLEGSADLFVRFDDHAFIIDYKTDRRRSPDVHKGQITSYVKALSELYKIPCYGVLCYVRDYSAGPIWDENGEEIEIK